MAPSLEEVRDKETHPSFKSHIEIKLIFGPSIHAGVDADGDNNPQGVPGRGEPCGVHPRRRRVPHRPRIAHLARLRHREGAHAATVSAVQSGPTGYCDKLLIVTVLAYNY